MDLLRDKFLTPLPVQYDTLGKRKVLNLACGGNHLLVAALDSDGKARLYAAGLNQYGQLGLGDKENRHVLTKVCSRDANFFDKYCGLSDKDDWLLTTIVDAKTTIAGTIFR